MLPFTVTYPTKTYILRYVTISLTSLIYSSFVSDTLYFYNHRVKKVLIIIRKCCFLKENVISCFSLLVVNQAKLEN